jgi:hypothetical protein
MMASFENALAFIKSARQLIGSDLETRPEIADLIRSIHLNLVTALYRFCISGRD